MPETLDHPATGSPRPLVSADTVLRGVPALGKLPPYVQYALIMFLSVLGGYFAGPSGSDATESERHDRIVIEKLESLETTVNGIDRRVIKIEAMREAERKPK